MDPATVSSAAPVVRRRVEHVMGLPVSLALRGRHVDTPHGHRAWMQVMEELYWVDRVFSTYRADSMIMRLGRGEIDLAACPPQVAEVLELGRRAAADSDGAFSVNLPVDPAHPNGPRRLDPSGVVKGWATERASRHLLDLDDTDFCLSAGGDIVCRAAAAAERPAWRIGIEDPRAPGAVLAIVPVRHGGVATSGTAHRGAHVVDARTGRPATALAAVTVIGPTLTWADIDATAAYAQGDQAADWLRGRPIYSALVVHHDGSTELVTPTARPPLTAAAPVWGPPPFAR